MWHWVHTEIRKSTYANLRLNSIVHKLSHICPLTFIRSGDSTKGETNITSHVCRMQPGASFQHYLVDEQCSSA